MRHELIFSMRMREYDVYFLDNTHLQRWEYLDAVREAMLEHISVFVWDLREDLTTVTFMVYPKIESKRC